MEERHIMNGDSHLRRKEHWKNSPFSSSGEYHAWSLNLEFEPSKILNRFDAENHTD